MSAKKESFLKRYMHDREKDIDQKLRAGWHWRMRDSLVLIEETEECYIYKPWPLIFRVYTTHLIRFAVLTILSSVHFLFALITSAAWLFDLHEFYICLKWLEKYNISKIKTVIFFLIIEVGFIIVSPYVRDFIWLIFKRIMALIAG